MSIRQKTVIGIAEKEETGKDNWICGDYLKN